MEINKQHLDAAITRLPQYQPPEDLWDDIAAQLDVDQNLDVALHELPTEAPPPAIGPNEARRSLPPPTPALPAVGRPPPPRPGPTTSLQAGGERHAHRHR